MSDWIYGIVAVMLLGTVVLQVIPEGTCQKYVRLFWGALLILTVIGPLHSWWDLSEEIRLSFERRILSSWVGTTFSGSAEEDPLWQEPDHWETLMKEQVNQKQENWIRQALEATVMEYGFLYLDHKVQWNAEGNWPERLTMWVGTPEEEKEQAIEEIASVDQIVSVNEIGFVESRSTEDEMYYEPSELRPLHQALQVVWQLKEEQIELYWQR